MPTKEEYFEAFRKRCPTKQLAADFAKTYGAVGWHTTGRKSEDELIRIIFGYVFAHVSHEKLSAELGLPSEGEEIASKSDKLAVEANQLSVESNQISANAVTRASNANRIAFVALVISIVAIVRDGCDQKAQQPNVSPPAGVSKENG